MSARSASSAQQGAHTGYDMHPTQYSFLVSTFPQWAALWNTAHSNQIEL